MASEQPTSPTTRPRGILKNPSFSGPSTSPPPQPTTLEDDEITKQNTLQNAGRRRSSSANLLRSGRARSSTPGHSHSNSLANGTNVNVNGEHDNDNDTEGRLKWDEANLYLTEQDRGQSMKITEPKTPYAPSYDPATDAEEMKRLELDARDIDVDELDLALRRQKKRDDSISDIPGLDIGEPQEDVPDGEGEGTGMSRSSSTRSKARVVPPREELGLTKEAEERHRKFEEKRKMHYEMKDVKGLLTHVSDDEDGQEDEEMPDAHENGVRA